MKTFFITACILLSFFSSKCQYWQHTKSDTPFKSVDKRAWVKISESGNPRCFVDLVIKLQYIDDFGVVKIYFDGDKYRGKSTVEFMFDKEEKVYKYETQDNFLTSFLLGRDKITELLEKLKSSQVAYVKIAKENYGNRVFTIPLNGSSKAITPILQNW